jgi:biotin carboxylase
VRLCLVAAKPTDAVTYGFLPAAARVGLEVFLLTDQPDGHAGMLARTRTDYGGRTDYGVQAQITGCDVHDARALIGGIAGLPRLDAVFSNSDHLQAQTALAADYFGLPGKDWRSCLRAKNKPLMRRRLAETGAEKVIAVEIAPGDEPPPGLPYPLVLKPAEGVASEDVTLVGSPEELAEQCAEFFGRRPGENLVAEEYLPGTLRTLETLGDGRKTWVLGGFLTTVSALPWFIEERLTWDPLPPGEDVDHVRLALGDLGVSFGACHTEFICGGQGGARLVEVNDRLIGDHDEFLMAELLHDDLFERVLRVHLGERLPAGPPPVGPGHAVADYIIAERAGILRTAPSGGPLEGAEPGVSLGYWPLRQPGDHITVTHSNRDYLGVITASGPDRAAVQRSVMAARAACRWDIGSCS